MAKTRQRGDSVELVARHLREEIASGRLAPGAPIRQAAVASRLGTSRIPVREALLRLENEGLVVIVPNSGAKVASLGFDECLEIYEIRERLEPLAIRESIERLSDESAAALSDLLAELNQTKGGAAWLAADRRLHLACYAGVEESRLVDTIVGYWNTTQPYRRALIKTFTDRDLDVVGAEHLLIVDAVRNRNARRAEELVRIHIERSRRRLAAHRGLFER